MRWWQMGALALGCGPIACGAPPARAPLDPPATVAEKRQTARDEPAPAPPPTRIAFLESADGKTKQSLPPGVTIAEREPNNQRTTVAPTALDLSTLPTATIPEPLAQKDAPKKLPASRARDDLRIEKIDTGYSSRHRQTSAVYVIVDAPMGRLQIGTVQSDRNASDRVYRTCGDKYYAQPLLTPARWETLTVNAAGVTEYRVVDAWFDAQSCEAAVVNETVVVPKPVLGGLMFAFQSRCDDCFPRHGVTFIAPALTQLAASGVGGKAQASHGKFSIVELPIRRGGAASFTGTVAAHALKPWLESMKWMSVNADVTMGAEITQAVPDRAPQAIAYATLVKR